MRMKAIKEINNTLLQSLFQRPQPQRSKSVTQIFSFFKQRMFPCEKDFIKFLLVDTLDDQMKYAIKIIRRLFFESNFPPPFSTLNDVLIIEESEKGVIYKDQHIARDHVLHVVYLYMLGIYIFFYNKQFFEKIRDSYRFKRNKGHDYENKEHDCIKDFISSWKYFCLYHDVGYSVEKLSNSSFNTSGKQEELRKSGFSFAFTGINLQKNIVIGSTIKMISHLVVLKQIINNSQTVFDKDNFLYQQLMKSNVRNYRLNNGLIESTKCKLEDLFHHQTKSWILLDKMYSSACIKLLLSVFKKTDIMVLAFQRKNGKPAFCVIPASDNSHMVCLFEGFNKTSSVNEIVKKPDIVFYDDYKNDSYNLQFYLYSKSDYGLLADDVDFFKELKNIIRRFPADLQRIYLRINSEQDLYDFQYSVFKYFEEEITDTDKNSALYNLMTQQQLPPQGQKFEDFIYDSSLPLAFSNKTRDELYDDFFEKLSKEVITAIPKSEVPSDKSIKKRVDFYTEKVLECITSLVLEFFVKTKDEHCKKFFKKISDEVITSIPSDEVPHNEKIAKYVNLYAEKIQEGLNSLPHPSEGDNSKLEYFANSFSREMSARLNVKLELRINILMLYSRFLKKNADLFSSHVSDIHLNYDYGTGVFSHNFSNLYESIVAKIKNAFGKYSNNPSELDYKKIESIYEKPHGNEQDHGMVSSYLYGFISAIFNNMVIGATEDQKNLLALLFNFSFDNGNMKEKVVDNYVHVQEDVFFALFMHNIAPANFKDVEKFRDYRTNINNPFAYLALLCDSLQQWNRPHAIHPSVLDRVPNLDASNEYDILIEDDIISVYEANNNIMQDKLKITIKTFEEYLESPDAFVEYKYSKMTQ